MMIESKDIYKISLISDTHMRLSHSAYDAINGDFDKQQIYHNEELYTGNSNDLANLYIDKDVFNCKKPDLIIHAGDIGRQDIIDLLEDVAPLVAVNGNCDFGSFMTSNGETQDFEYMVFHELPIAVAHQPGWLESFVEGGFMRPSQLPKNAKKPKLKIHGHTHESKIINHKNGTACICPGSASHGRYGTPNSIANVYITYGKLLYAELIEV